MIKKILIILILISSAYFFRLVFIPRQLILLSQFGITVLMFVVIVIQEVYGKSEMIKQNFKYPILLIFAGVFLSMLIAQAYHNQNYLLTVWAQRFMYYYLFYFFLHILKPEIKDLEKIILFLGIGYAIAYLIQYAVYPTAIFDVRQEADRGTIRIFIPGSSFMGLSLYMGLQRFYTQNKLRYIFMVIMFLSIYILTGTRYALSVTVLVVIISLLFSKVIRSRYLIYFLFLISLIPIYFIFQDIFIGLLEVSEKQSENIESDIRIRAATFFLTDFFPNTLAYFFGNGQDHMGSIYGMRVNAYKIYHGFFQSDVGFIGDFSKFGIFFGIGALWLLFKAWKAPVSQEYYYVKFRILSYILVLPVAGFFSSSSAIVVLCVIMYIIDKSIHEKNQNKPGRESEASNEISGPDETGRPG